MTTLAEMRTRVRDFVRDTNADETKRKSWLTCERIQTEIRKPIHSRSLELRIDSSIGLRLLTSDTATVDSVIQDADAAMYRAKQAGKGRVVRHGL